MEILRICLNEIALSGLEGESHNTSPFLTTRPRGCSSIYCTPRLPSSQGLTKKWKPSHKCPNCRLIEISKRSPECKCRKIVSGWKNISAYNMYVLEPRWFLQGAVLESCGCTSHVGGREGGRVRGANHPPLSSWMNPPNHSSGTSWKEPPSEMALFKFSTSRPLEWLQVLSKN